MTEYKCGSAKSCKYGDMCKPNFNICVCAHYKAEEPQTNEEWFCSLPTEDKAKWLSQRSQILYDCGQRDVFPKIMYEEDWELWLKQPHREE